MRKRLLLGLLALVVLAPLGGLVARWATGPAAHNINAETAGLIREGMDVRDVEALFGAPPGDYRVRTRSIHLIPGHSGQLVPNGLWGEPLDWLSDDVWVSVWVEDGRVAYAECGPLVRRRESLLNRLRRWLRL